MDQLYTTTALQGVVDSLLRPSSFLVDMCFGTVVNFDTEEVMIDLLSRSRRVAAFAAPYTEGRVVKERGWTTRTFKPAYTKELTPLRPYRAMRRTAGETLGSGSLTPQQRDQARLIDTLVEHVEAIVRRKELMAAECLRLMQVTVEGEDYPRHVVSYPRAPELRIVLTGDDKWDGQDSDPLGDLQAAMTAVHRTEGAVVTAAIFDSDSWDACWKSESFRLAVSTLHLAIAAGQGPTAGAVMIGPEISADGVVYKGRIGSLECYVYSAWYEDPVTGTTKPYLPSGTVLLTSGQMEGMQLQGAILDHDSLQAVEYFSKSWVVPNPSSRMVLTQSAPLLAPRRVNAGASMQVL